jgi:hypothetical protein
MSITNEAKVRVKLDGTEAEVSIGELARSIQAAMNKATNEAKKAQSAFSKLGEFSQKFFFTVKSFGMVFNSLSRLSRMAFDAGKQAGGNAEQFQRFSKSVERLKIQGGNLINVFLSPLMNLTSRLAEYLETLNQKTVMMIGSMGLAAVTVAKLIPVIRSLGVTSKVSLGWIGLIITAVAGLYTAWQTNFGGIQDSIRSLWDIMVQFYEKTTNWAELIGNIFKSLGDVIHMVLSGKITDLQGALVLFFASLSAKLDIQFKKFKTDVAKITTPVFGAMGEDAGSAFASGFETGIIDNGMKERKGWRRFEKEMRKLDKTMRKIASGKFMGDEGTEDAQKEDSPFEVWKQSLEETALTAKTVFETIGSSISTLADRITAAIFGAKIRLQDLWKSIAQDFVKLFIEEILKQIAIKLVTGILALLALFDKAKNDKMAIRIGQDYARLFTQGVMQGLNPQGLALSMAGGGSVGFNDSNIVSAINQTNAKLGVLANIGSPVVNNHISSRQLYDAVRWERNKELTRRGKEVNNSLF